jgi:hypothetical protein
MVPDRPKIYHITHVDRLASIVADSYLYCDAEVLRQEKTGTNIGMSSIKQRRLKELFLASHPKLFVGDCVPFYFCPRSIMLYLIYMKNNKDLDYGEGQEPIIHLQADLHACVAWADQHQQRWAFTSSNAGSLYFEDFCDLSQLNKLRWSDIEATQWQNSKDAKQAEFLLEKRFPWHLIECIGVHSSLIYQKVANTLSFAQHQPRVEIKRTWYY